MNSEKPQSDHPELASEQAYIDRAYDRLNEMQREAVELASGAMRAGIRGGTFQARYERDVLTRVGLLRQEQLEIGDESLCFGRIDRDDDRYYVGRRGVLAEDRTPLVIDWRVPAAAPFYRATGRDPLGVRLRRHLLCRGRTLIAIEDEEFGGAGGELGLSGLGALVSALEQPRSGSMRDIVATVQAEQDEIIRSDVQGILAVQGGPGTGKTAVALHRAAYLLFTYRKRLERQGVLIVGPNHLFLRYIDQVLPALGETGADLFTIADLIQGVTVTLGDTAEASRVKGDLRMTRVLARAVASYQRAPAGDVVVRFDQHKLVIPRARAAALVRVAKRSRRSHNRRRAMLHSILVKDLLRALTRAEKKLNAMLPGLMDRKAVLAELREHPDLLRALDEMWPALTPERVLHDLLTSRAQIEAAAGHLLRPEDRDALYRARADGLSRADVPLLDEIFSRTGAVRKLGKKVSEADEVADEIKTYGHVLVDEVQDLAPMALRMLARRSRSGWMTIVGDLAQSVGPWTPSSWDEIVTHLRPRAGSERRELTINYRTPAEIMRLAEHVRHATAPGLRAARAVRRGHHEPSFEHVDARALDTAVADVAKRELDAVQGGTVVVIAPPSMLEQVGEMLGVEPTIAEAPGAHLSATITLADAETVKGLEFDGVVLVEPSKIVDEHAQGMRALYVALTRATKRLAIVHAEPLPRALEV